MAEKNTEAITVSDTEKPKRGRPPVFDESYLASLKGIWPEIQSRRAIVNMAYSLRAYGVVGNDKRFRWLIDKKKGAKNIHGWWKPGILSELGRIENDDDLKMVAAHVCKLKPSTSREAVGIIRNWRLDERKPADTFQLAETICKTINQYISLHPDLTFDDVGLSLTIVRECFDEVRREGDDESPPPANP